MSRYYEIFTLIDNKLFLPKLSSLRNCSVCNEWHDSPLMYPNTPIIQLLAASCRLYKYVAAKLFVILTVIVTIEHKAVCLIWNFRAFFVCLCCFRCCSFSWPYLALKMDTHVELYPTLQRKCRRFICLVNSMFSYTINSIWIKLPKQCRTEMKLHTKAEATNGIQPLNKSITDIQLNTSICHTLKATSSNWNWNENRRSCLCVCVYAIARNRCYECIGSNATNTLKLTTLAFHFAIAIENCVARHFSL